MYTASNGGGVQRERERGRERERCAVPRTPLFDIYKHTECKIREEDKTKLVRITAPPLGGKGAPETAEAWQAGSYLGN